MNNSFKNYEGRKNLSKILEKEEKDNTTKNKPTEHKLSIGGITYIVVSHFSESSADTAKDKIERLIMRDLNAS